MCFIKAGAISLYCCNYLTDKLFLRICSGVSRCFRSLVITFLNHFDYESNGKDHKNYCKNVTQKIVHNNPPFLFYNCENLTI